MFLNRLTLSTVSSTLVLSSLIILNGPYRTGIFQTWPHQGNIEFKKRGRVAVGIKMSVYKTQHSTSLGTDNAYVYGPFKIIRDDNTKVLETVERVNLFKNITVKGERKRETGPLPTYKHNLAFVRIKC